MRIAVIGAGITGLAAAYELSKNGYEVDILEKEDTPGGIAGTFNYDNFELEKYYHHFFKSDEHITRLLKEINVYDKVLWPQSKMGYFSGGRTYDFGTPVSLLKFKPLPFIDKVRFGIATLRIMGKSNWKQLEDVTAHDWIMKAAGERAYNTVWRPLLVTKFADRYKEISMSWMWGKIKLRGSSKEKGKEVLGYIEGSTKIMIDKLVEAIEKNGGKLKYNCEIKRIEKDTQFTLRTSYGELKYDRILSTVPLTVFLDMGKEILPPDYSNTLRNIEYTAVVCTILILKKQFTKYYWLNIGDESIPFGGLIEHTNILKPEQYNNHHILYVSNYVFKDSKYYSMTSEEILREYIPHLKKINPEFSEDWVEDVISFKDEYAQPVIRKNYSRIKPEYRSPVDNLYLANMCSIYPEDRGVNYAIREGIKAALAVAEQQQEGYHGK